MNTRARLILLLTTVVLFSGCGPDRPETVTVRGRITHAGGDWPKSGCLYFTPAKPAEGFPGHSGKASFDTRGKFNAWTWKRGDGLMPGTYKVVVMCWKGELTMESSGKSYVPAAYQSGFTSPLELTIESGQDTIELEWDVPKP